MVGFYSKDLLGDVLNFDESYYELLGVSKSVDAMTLKKAFHRLSKTLHPDTTLLPAEEAKRQFCKVYEAYEVLSDSSKRVIYDREIEIELLKAENAYKVNKNSMHSSSQLKHSFLDARRPLSGSELFSLFLLCIALLLSVLLGIGFAFLDGRDFQFRPSWLFINQPINKILNTSLTNDYITFSRNTFEPTFVNSH